QILFLIWLICYLAGPLVETFDYWDSPQEEMTDIATSACGALIWLAAGICAAILLLREFCKLWRSSALLRINPPLLLLTFDLVSPLRRSEPIPIFDTSPLRV